MPATGHSVTVCSGLRAMPRGPFWRSKKEDEMLWTEAIQMQETAEMVAWLKQKSEEHGIFNG